MEIIKNTVFKKKKTPRGRVNSGNTGYIVGKS